MHIRKFVLLCLNLLNSVKEKFQYSVKLHRVATLLENLEKSGN